MHIRIHIIGGVWQNEHSSIVCVRTWQKVGWQYNAWRTWCLIASRQVHERSNYIIIIQLHISCCRRCDAMYQHKQRLTIIASQLYISTCTVSTWIYVKTDSFCNACMLKLEDKKKTNIRHTRLGDLCLLRAHGPWRNWQLDHRRSAHIGRQRKSHASMWHDMAP
jgi:hypothetical protein